MIIAKTCKLTLAEVVEAYLRQDDSCLYAWGGEVGFGYYDHQLFDFYQNLRDELTETHDLDEIVITGGRPGNTSTGQALVIARKSFWNTLSDDRRAEVIACYKLSRRLLRVCSLRKIKATVETLSVSEHGRFVLSLLRQRAGNDHRIHDCVKNLIDEVLA